MGVSSAELRPRSLLVARTMLVLAMLLMVLCIGVAAFFQGRRQIERALSKVFRGPTSSLEKVHRGAEQLGHLADASMRGTVSFARNVTEFSCRMSFLCARAGALRIERGGAAAAPLPRPAGGEALERRPRSQSRGAGGCQGGVRRGPVARRRTSRGVGGFQGDVRRGPVTRRLTSPTRAAAAMLIPLTSAAAAVAPCCPRAYRVASAPRPGLGRLPQPPRLACPPRAEAAGTPAPRDAGCALALLQLLAARASGQVASKLQADSDAAVAEDAAEAGSGDRVVLSAREPANSLVAVPCSGLVRYGRY
ncbi:unnamed protein product [Prorocentrum cordatum]|uniref:Uncharacterized protein n=1 Tax=Prorocentrum cordatum TaxID=2364126 RepID=A0ABN9TR95_9DINO|nr:unnamed protein product [Polarella glacialis]